MKAANEHSRFCYDYSMSELADFFVLIGAILLSGLAIDYLGRKTRLPRVTLLLLFGLSLALPGSTS